MEQPGVGGRRFGRPGQDRQRLWLNGQLVVDRNDIRWSKTDDLGIDNLDFSTFFGGGYSWRTSKYETMYLDDFKIEVVE